MKATLEALEATVDAQQAAEGAVEVVEAAVAVDAEGRPSVRNHQHCPTLR